MGDVNVYILRDELNTDPEGRGYSGMTDAQVLTDINEKRYTMKRRVPASEVIGYARSVGVTYDIEEILTDVAATVNQQKAAKEFVRLFDTPDALLDFETLYPGTSTPTVELQMDQLVAAGAISATDKTNVLALADVAHSRIEQLHHIGAVAVLGDVEMARLPA